MKLYGLCILLLVILLTADNIAAQKRRKGDKKKEAESTTTLPKQESKAEKQRRRETTIPTTITTVATFPTTAAPIVEEDVDEEVYIVNEPRTVTNSCPPELKSKEGETLSCTCSDQLDEDAIMVECVALTSSEQMRSIFKVTFAIFQAFRRRTTKYFTVIPHG